MTVVDLEGAISFSWFGNSNNQGHFKVLKSPFWGGIETVYSTIRLGLIYISKHI